MTASHLHPHAHPDPTTEHEVRDPVCGMSVDPHTAKHRAEYDSHPYYFCPARCREKFVADPERKNVV